MPRRARAAPPTLPLCSNFGGRGILLGSDSTEVQYMDVDFARTAASPPPAAEWHDSVNTLVRNNVLVGGKGAGMAFYSAKDAVAVHNTFYGVAQTMQVGGVGGLCSGLFTPDM